MSAPSITVSQTDFCGAVYNAHVTSEPTSGYDTPIPRARILYILRSYIKSHKHYVGLTSRALINILYEHRASVQKDGQITPVSCHFNNDRYSHNDMTFSAVKWCTQKFEASNTARYRGL